MPHTHTPVPLGSFTAAPSPSSKAQPQVAAPAKGILYRHYISGRHAQAAHLTLVLRLQPRTQHPLCCRLPTEIVYFSTVILGISRLCRSSPKMNQVGSWNQNSHTIKHRLLNTNTQTIEYCGSYFYIFPSLLPKENSLPARPHAAS